MNRIYDGDVIKNARYVSRFNVRILISSVPSAESEVAYKSSVAALHAVRAVSDGHYRSLIAADHSCICALYERAICC